MKTFSRIIFAVVVASFVNSCGSVTSQQSEIQSGTTIANGVPPFPVDVSIARPAAGVDYPTDRPVPDVWRSASVLVIENQRVRVPNAVKLVQPQAGVDYPTDIPMPMEFRSRKVLVLDQYHRLPLLFGKSVRDGIELWLRNGNRTVAVKTMAAIEKAKAGIDFPTDSSEDVAYVIVLTSGKRIAIF